MADEKKMKVIVPPEVLEQLAETMDAEELQMFLAEIQQMAESGELFEQSTPVDMDTLSEEDPEMYAQLKKQMDDAGFDDFDEWVQWKTAPRLLN